MRQVGSSRQRCISSSFDGTNLGSIGAEVGELPLIGAITLTGVGVVVLPLGMTHGRAAMVGLDAMIVTYVMHDWRA